MPELRQIVRYLQEKNEVEWIEVKNANTRPEMIGEYLSALSNAAALADQQAGYLLYGLEDGSWNILGTNFKVQAARYKPVLFQGNAFIRVGSYKKPLKDHPEKERKLWLLTTQQVFETLDAKAALKPENVLEMLNVQAYFSLINEPIPSSNEAIIEKFEQDKIVRRDLDGLVISNLGAILFSKDLNYFSSISRKALRIIIYKGNTRLETKREYPGSKGYALGFAQMINFLNDLIPSNEIIEKAIRKEVKLYPILALREVIANAIIHQDLTITGAGPMVEIFENRIEVTNPGKPLINTDRFIDHSPQSRNEMLASLMRRMGMCEERGSGIDKVVQLCEIYQLSAPDFISGDNYTRVILYAPRDFKDMDKSDRIRACYQHCCLKYVSGEFMTNQSIRDRFAIHAKNYPMASRIISDSKEANKIKDMDPTNTSNKHYKYIPYWA